ncbi:MAG: hypothetical protein IJP38_08745 [Oscillospiraceae bacterium]|nr:hypothetical protein [Oscillospiraceae bacterium]
MNISAKELDRIIDEILALGAPPKPEIKRKRGRQRKAPSPTWALQFYEPDKNRSYALISMCIKENPDQSIEQLALRLSANKGRPPSECLEVLMTLRETGKLGYYDDISRVFRTWHEKEASYGLENLCG